MPTLGMEDGVSSGMAAEAVWFLDVRDLLKEQEVGFQHQTGPRLHRMKPRNFPR